MGGSFSYPNSPAFKPFLLLCFSLFCHVSVLCCSMPPSFLFFGGDPPTPRRPFVMPSTVYYCKTHLHMLQHLPVFTFYKLQTRFFVDECMFVSARVSVSWYMCWKEWVGELSHIYRPIIISLLISLCSDEINFLLCRCVYVCMHLCESVYISAEFSLRSTAFTFHLNEPPISKKVCVHVCMLACRGPQ